MGNIRKWLAKDKFLLVRGSIVLVLLLVFCTSLFTGLVLRFARAFEESRVADAATSFAGQFEQMIRNEFMNLDAVATLIHDEPDLEAMFERSLYDNYPYSETGVMSDGHIRHSDGSVNAIEYETAYIYSENGVPRGRFIALADGSILLCVTIDETNELVVRFDSEGVADTLRSTLNGDYNFAIYNASTGAYLVNQTDFTEGGYYDALLSLNENGSTAGLLNDETTIARLDSGDFIAQQRTAIRPWNVALVIPKAELTAYTEGLTWMPRAAVIAVIMLLAVYGLFLTLGLRRMHAETRDANRMLEDTDRLICDLAWEAEVTLFIYHRGQEEPMSCYDGLRLLGGVDGNKQYATLHALEEACGLNETDSEQLHERLRELERGGSVELMLNGALRDREVRRLRFTLNAYGASDSTIICSVRDCTQELLTQNRAEAEQSYLETNMQRTTAVWQMNVSRNLWRCVYMLDSAKQCALGPLEKTGWREFTADLDGVLRNYIHPADYADYGSKMSIPSIATFYRSGRREINLDYRVRTGGEENYEWHRMRVHLYSEPETEDILANIYVFNVDVEKNAELERGNRKRIFEKTLRALSGIYYALYYVDLDNDLCYAAKSYNGEVVSQLCLPFRETFDSYLDGVHPDDRAEIRTMLDAFNIRRTFVEGSRFQRREYRRQSGDDYRWAAIIIQPARYENGRIKDVVIALRNLVGNRPDLDLE